MKNSFIGLLISGFLFFNNPLWAASPTGEAAGAPHALGTFNDREAGETFTNSLGMKFVLIPAGQFLHGWSARNEAGELVPHKRLVTISKPFYLGQYEVTQEQWSALMDNNPAHFKGPLNPVETVSWKDLQSFLYRLNRKEGGGKYRLPTEAEWMRAAMAGTWTKWFFGDNPADLGEYAWFSENSSGAAHPVGQKKPNPWGLYDIYGNVSEWVADWAASYQAGEAEVTDPAGPDSSPFFTRIVRGGNFDYEANICDSSDRDHQPPGARGFNLGFRLAFSPDE
jgi:formylglycine-generating enzyme required for sulfatase activity